MLVSRWNGLCRSGIARLSRFKSKALLQELALFNREARNSFSQSLHTGFRQAFSVQPLWSLCLCGCRKVRYNNHRVTETTEVAQRRAMFVTMRRRNDCASDRHLPPQHRFSDRT